MVCLYCADPCVWSLMWTTFGQQSTSCLDTFPITAWETGYNNLLIELMQKYSPSAYWQAVLHRAGVCLIVKYWIFIPLKIFRRESNRQIKRPKKDLPEDHPQHSSKPKKGRLSTRLKYCNLILKELLAKRHQVSDDHIEMFTNGIVHWYGYLLTMFMLFVNSLR